MRYTCEHIHTHIKREGPTYRMNQALAEALCHIIAVVVSQHRHEDLRPQGFSTSAEEGTPRASQRGSHCVIGDEDIQGDFQCLYSDGENNPFTRQEKSTIDERRGSILCTKRMRDWLGWCFASFNLLLKKKKPKTKSLSWQVRKGRGEKLFNQNGATPFLLYCLLLCSHHLFSSGLQRGL